MNDSGKHGASFTGLSRSDSKNSVNGAVDEALSDTFAERYLIGEEGVGNRIRHRELVEITKSGLADDNLRKKA